MQSTLFPRSFLTIRLSRLFFKGFRIGLLYFLPNLIYVSASIAAPMPSSEEVLNLVGISREQIAKLHQGEIIAHDIPEATGKELAMSIAIYLPVAIENIVEYIKNGDLLAIDPDITAHGEISKNAKALNFKEFAFSEKQHDEAVDLLNSEAGDHFNLSNQEITSFASIRNTLSSADKKALTEIVSQKYREMLLQRCQAYQIYGLAGITAYSRENGVVDPASELRIATENNKLLVQFFPELFRGLINYPVGLPSGIEEHFHWINREIENRPTAILVHRIHLATKTGALIVAREFYVGHSYNSSHLIVGALPYRDGTLVFYGQRTSTDQVTGMASGLRHNIGREQMKEQMVLRLKQLSKTVQKASKAD